MTAQRQGRPRGGRGNDLLRNGLLLLAALTLTVVALELTLRSTEEPREAAAGPSRDNEWLFYEYDPLLGWRNRPGAHGWFSVPDSRTWVQINSGGRRDLDDGLRDRRSRRILVLGDSFTWGFGVDRRDRYTDRLASLLPGGIEVLNAGVSGYGTDQELLYLSDEGLALQASLVIVQFGLEDIINNHHSVQYSYPKPYFRLIGEELVLRNIPVPRRSAPWDVRFGLPSRLQSRHAATPGEPRGAGEAGPIARRLKLFLRSNLRSYGFIVDRVVRPWLLPAREPTSGTAGSTDPLTAAIFREMRDLVRSRGATLVVLFVPYRFHMQPGVADASHQAYLSFFDEEGIACLDLWKPFRREAARGVPLYFEVDQHWAPAGHDLAGELLSRFLQRSGLLDPPTQALQPTEGVEVG